jgi:microcystin degradation protein MlrC
VPYFISRLLARPEFASGALTAIYASIADAAAVSACYEAGLGHDVSVSVGGKLDRVHGHPLPVRGAVVRHVADDPVGGNIAVLRVGGVHLILTTRRKPHHFLKDFTALGLDPMAHKVVAVKIGYLEPELRQIARHALLALTPGAVDQDIAKLPYARVVRPIFPLDPDVANPGLTGRLFGR